MAVAAGAAFAFSAGFGTTKSFERPAYSPVALVKPAGIEMAVAAGAAFAFSAGYGTTKSFERPAYSPVALVKRLTPIATSLWLKPIVGKSAQVAPVGSASTE